MVTYSTIKYDKDKAVLGLGIGKRIALDVKSFTTIADAFFAEMTAKFCWADWPTVTRHSLSLPGRPIWPERPWHTVVARVGLALEVVPAEDAR